MSELGRLPDGVDERGQQPGFEEGRGFNGQRSGSSRFRDHAEGWCKEIIHDHPLVVVMERQVLMAFGILMGLVGVVQVQKTEEVHAVIGILMTFMLVLMKMGNHGLHTGKRVHFLAGKTGQEMQVGSQ
ncbi:MAG: hypothetical protein KKG00_06930 [Bacteroidetes bacterium]|nr:hypothetical protein [Bacteroidota bacterium]